MLLDKVRTVFQIDCFILSKLVLKLLQGWVKAMVAIISGLDDQNQVRVEIEVQGLYKRVPYGAIVDTGFTGGMVLPLFVAVDIGLEKVGASTVTLADGTVMTLPTFLTQIKLGNKTFDVATIVMGSDILIGIEALSNHRICISTGTGNVVVEEAATTEDYKRLTVNLQKLTGAAL